MIPCLIVFCSSNSGQSAYLVQCGPGSRPTCQHTTNVSITNCYSNLLPVVSGVPQGSILGPLLFLLFINDMSSYIHQCHLLKFADDTKCFKSITALSDCDHLQEDIAALFTWYADSDLYFNLKKFVHLFFKCKFNTIHIPCLIYLYLMSTITKSDKGLGLLLSEDLS